MKLYSVSRVLLFKILADFDLELQEAGQLFVTAFISDQTARAILAKHPKAISPI